LETIEDPLTKHPPPDLSGRKILLLQGPSSRFLWHLGCACTELGAEVTRLGFAPGDRLYWSARAGRYLAYRGDPGKVGAFLKDLITRMQVTDVVMLGDGRLYHAEALRALRGMAHAPVPWVFELGYLRPNLISVETWGMGGRSAIPAAFANHDGGDDTGQPAHSDHLASFLRYAAMDVGYHMINLCFGWLFYPSHRHHALYHPLREYGGWILKGLRKPARSAALMRAQQRIGAHQGQIFVFPLQLLTDYQIRDHGTGQTMEATINRIVTSFSRHAPATAILVIKEHPLDNGLMRWSRRVAAIAAHNGISKRVIFLDGGDLEAVLNRASGVVTINSTVGLTAISKGVPCLVLGKAIYDHSRMTARPDIDAFWTDPPAPDPETVNAFLRFLRARYHVAGSFDGPGAVEGARNLARRFTAPPPGKAA
jgi:capsular polysaccharide export protein